MESARKLFIIALFSSRFVTGERIDSFGLAGDDSNTPESEKVKALLKANDLICGTSKIKSLLQSGDDGGATGWRNIDWSSLYAEADEFVKEKNAKVKKITAELARLADQIKRKEGATKTWVTDAQIEKLISDSITKTTEGFMSVRRPVDSKASLARAVESKCGSARTPRMPRGASKNTVAVFQTEAPKVLTGSVCTSGDAVFKKCNAMLPGDPVGSGTDNSFCDEFCQRIGSVAQEVADKSGCASGGASADALKQQAEDQGALLRQTQTEIGECEAANQTIGMFSGQLEELTKSVKDTFDKCTDAREDMFDAEDALWDLQDQEKVASDHLAAMVALLTEKDARTTKAKAALTDIQGREKTTRKQLDDALVAWGTAKIELKNAQEASLVAQTLKQSVSETMMKMVLYVKSAIRDPLINIGLGVDTRIDDYFESDATQLTAHAEVGTHLGGLFKFCTEKAAVFNAVKKSVNMAPLCKLPGTEASLLTAMDQQVQSRIEKVVEELKSVQSWGDPYKGHTLTAAQVKEHEDAGEPKGLWEIISVFASTPFWRSYLKNWIMKGTFLAIYGDLDKVVEALDKARTTAKQLVDQVTATLAEVLIKRKAAETELNAALWQKGIAQNKKNKAQKAFDALQDDVRKAQAQLDALKAASKQADESWQAAKALLAATRKEGTSFLQAFEAMEAQYADEAETSPHADSLLQGLDM